MLICFICRIERRTGNRMVPLAFRHSPRQPHGQRPECRGGHALPTHFWRWYTEDDAHLFYLSFRAQSRWQDGAARPPTRVAAAPRAASWVLRRAHPPDTCPTPISWRKCCWSSLTRNALMSRSVQATHFILVADVRKFFGRSIPDSELWNNN